MLKQPKWARGAEPTVNGWVRNGELLKSQKISQEDIDHWHQKEVVEDFLEEGFMFEDLIEGTLKVSEVSVDTVEEVEEDEDEVEVIKVSDNHTRLNITSIFNRFKS